MTTDKEPTDFNERRQISEPWVTSVLREHGLPEDASLEEIATVAKTMWGSMPKRAQVVEMVLGRTVKGDELANDPEFGRIILEGDADRAFDSLYSLRTLEAIEAGNEFQGDIEG